MKSLAELSVANLLRVISLKEQIESLEGQLWKPSPGESSTETAWHIRGPRSRQGGPNADCPQRIGANLSNPSHGRERCDGQKQKGPGLTQLRRNAA